MRRETRWAKCSSRFLIFCHRAALSCSPEAQRPVRLRLRAIHPNSLFLKPAISRPPPMKRVARIEPSTVWMVHTAICSPRLRSTAQSFVSGFVVTCCANLGGVVNRFSMGVCSHQRPACRTSEGLPISPPSGSSLPVRRTLSQDQQLPVHNLMTM